MGDIQQYMHDLKFAQYGSDLKSAIKNCLSQCYEDSGGTDDLIAWQSIEEFKRTVALSVRPVGSIFITSDITFDPNIRFGGTWVVWGAGRSPVGVNTSDTDFATVEKTGGAKTVTLSPSQMPSHTHTYTKAGTATGGTALTVSQIPSHTHSGKVGTITTSKKTVQMWSSALPVTQKTSAIATASASGSGTTGATGSGTAHAHSISTSSNSTGAVGKATAVNNLQPYITCCMWKRTA